MKRASLLILSLAAFGAARPSLAIVPMPPPPDPVRLAAARTFVLVLPIRERVAGPSYSSYLAGGGVFEGLYGRATTLLPRPKLERIAGAMRLRVDVRVTEVLPEIMPAAVEDIATGYARSLSVAELEAATAFYGSSNGRAFAAQLVMQDATIGQALQMRLGERLAPELETILADADAAESLRERVNASGGRR